MCVRGGRIKVCPEYWSQTGVCAHQSCPRTLSGKNAKLIIPPIKDSYFLHWVEYERDFLKMPIYEDIKYFSFSCFYLLWCWCWNLWRIWAYGEDRCQKEVEKYKCLICCCTWNLVSIIYIVRFSTCLCPVSLMVGAFMFVCFCQRKMRRKWYIVLTSDRS